MKDGSALSVDLSSLAAIQYMGEPGVSRDCMEAVMRLLQFRDQILRARILSSSRSDSLRDHALLLTVGADLIAIKSGFASGYLGEGSRSFSYVLQLLKTHGAAIEEFDVGELLMERLDHSSLTRADLDLLDESSPVKFPTRWHDYIFEKHFERGRSGSLWEEFHPVIPFAIIESRIADLALSFWENPDGSLLKGFRRLEDIVRERIGSSDTGTKLFSQAFHGESAKLEWKGVDSGEKVGRASLFTGAYSAFRNPRAHRELKDGSHGQLSEFLLLNLLFRLEGEATSVQESET